uniref:PDZ domain-containing protein n=1 Tax=Globisporangium ultimum (strain ATCC 200006 / CBS 805.95 / DAOM BR144) TaxID=431595 RepID=K3XCA2_GLOUD
MAKAILSSILESQLGKYVDGLTSDSLQVGLWSGELVLQNLSLKPHALAELDLPVTVIKGSIERIHVVVPWNQLGSASVQITIDGIYALVVPNTTLPTQDEVRQHKINQIERQDLVRQHNRFAEENNHAGEDESTFLSRLTERIVDNLQVTLRDIHFRYEDNISNLENPFACGVMIKSFAFHTTDAEGSEVFVDRSAKKEKFTHKAVKLTQCCMYWDRVPKTEPLRLLQNHPDVEVAMRDMVHVMSHSVEQQHTSNVTAQDNASRETNRLWILRPCSLSVQLTKNESQDYAMVAKFTIQAKINDIAFGLSREQYEDILFLHKAFMGRRAIEAYFLQARCRPFHNARKLPRAWWDYASRLVLARNQKTGEQSRSIKKVCLRWSTVQKTAGERKAYVEAFRRQLRKGSALDPASQQSKCMKIFEEIYPVDVIMAVRDFAEDEEMKAIQKKKKLEESAAASQAASRGGSWYNYFFAGASTESTATTSSDKLVDIFSAEGKADLKQAYDDVVTKEKAHTVPRGCNLFSVKLQLKSGSLSLYHTGQLEPFLTGKADGSLAVNLQPSDEWDTKFRLQHFEILNGKAKDTEFYTFCSMSSTAKIVNPKLPCVSIDASMRKDTREGSSKGDTSGTGQDTLKVRVSAMPVRVMADPSFLLFVQDFFQSMLPEQQMERVWNFATSSVSDWIFSEQENDLLASTVQHKQARLKYDVSVDMNAPVFVVPESIADPKSSVVVIDLGQISFRSEDAGRSDKSGTRDLSTNIAPEKLLWRLDVKNIQLLLGRLDNLDWSGEDFGKFAKLVEELSLDFDVKTLVPTSKFGPSKDRAAVALDPSIAVQATIPQIAVSTTEDQLITLARIYSSLLAQFSSIGSLRQLPTAGLDSSEAPSSNPAVVTNVDAAKSKIPTTDKYHMKAQLLLGEVIINLRESAVKDAFRLKIIQTSFDLGIFSSQYVFQARLQSLLMEDMLYDTSSCFRQLMSTGAADEMHLVSIDVTMYPPSNQAYDKTGDSPVDREATFMVADVQFNVLDVQWNPSSMSLIYRIGSSYASALQYHIMEDDLFGAKLSEMVGDAQSGSQEGESSYVDAHRNADTLTSQSPKPVTELEASRLPSILIRGSLVEFSVTFNKDDLNRQLVQLSIKDASLELSTQEIYDIKTRQQVSVYELKGDLGNFIALDLSMTKDPVYSPLVGLDESASSSSPLSPQKPHRSKVALLKFSYAFDPTVDEKSILSLQFQPVRMVYYHQQVLELVDYLFEGILGAMVSQTLFNATQMLLSEAESGAVFQVSFEKPTVILPLRMVDANHVKITAEAFSLRHFPSSAVHYFGTGPLDERKKEITPGESLASNVVRGNDCVSFRADYKQVTLKNVNIFCTTNKSRKASPARESKLGYQSVLAYPIDLVVDVEDLASSGIKYEDNAFLPRFTIKCTMTELALLLQQRNYLIFVAVLMDNFGAEQLQATTGSASGSNAADLDHSARPNVTYAYSRTDLEAVTMQLGFTMKNVRCILYEEDADEDSYDMNRDLSSVSSTVDATTSAFARPGEKATSEIVASDFSVALNFLQNSSPNVTVRVASFLVRELLHGVALEQASASSTDQSELSGGVIDTMEPQGTVLVCTQPTQVIYSWDSVMLTCGIDIDLSNVTGIFVPEVVLGLVEFFTLPAKGHSDSLPQPAVDSHSLIASDDTAVRGNRPTTKRRQSISEILKQGQGPEYAMTVSDLFPHAGQQQQIVAIRFTPIEMFVSYDDGCIGVETLRNMNESMVRHSSRKKQHETEKILSKSTNGGVLSPKAFAHPNAGAAGDLEIHRYFTCERCNIFMNVTYAPTPASGTSFPPPSITISGGGNFVVAVSYYNPDTRTWHQMCHDWGLDVSVQGSIYDDLSLETGQSKASDNELHVILTANQPLDLLVTHGLLEVVASAGGAWNRRVNGAIVGSPPASPSMSGGSPRPNREANEKKKHAPCVVSNETGLQMTFWLTNGRSNTDRQVLPSGEIADLHYVHTVGCGSGVVRKYASSDREENMRLCIELMDSSFQPVQGIIFEQLGSRAFPLVDVGGGLSQFHLNCYAKLVDGRILLSISSQMKLVNNLSMPIQLLVNDPTWTSPVDIGVLYPFKESAIPVLLSLGTELRVRPIDDTFSWSAPIPVQTRSAVELKVEAASNGAATIRSAIFCVSMSIEQSLRVVCLSEPIVLVNKLPTEVEYRVRSPLMNNANRSTENGSALGVGAKGGVWWSDSAQRPQFKLAIEGCHPTKWIELVHPGTKSGEVFSVMLERQDGRSFKLLIQVIEQAAKSVHVFLYAEVWFINRTGLDLVYGNESDSEAYVPPPEARAFVGNAQICAYSSASESSGGSPPAVRVRMGTCNWSSRFVADPRKLSWQDECLALRSDRRSDDGSTMLYEFGVSADYSTRHFGSITTLVSVIPRYLILNHSPYTVLLLEDSVHSGQGGNAAHHILAKGDVYALYWVTGARSKLHASIIAGDDYGWSKTFTVDKLSSNELVIPAVARGPAGAESKNVTLQISVKRGSISQSTFVIVIDEMEIGDDAVSPVASPVNSQGHPQMGHVGWDTFSLHTQVAGIIVTVADKKAVDDIDNSNAKRLSSRSESSTLFGGSSNVEESNENVARLTISRISMETNISLQGTSAKMNVMGVKVEDLLANSKNPIVLRPVFRGGSYDPYRKGTTEKYFLEVAYVEKPHAKYMWIEKLRVEVQDVKITTSMRFVDRLNGLVKETVSHFQRRSLSSSSLAASSLIEEKESDENILEYFVTSAASEEDDASMTSLTGKKIYIESCVIEPVRVVVSFSREKGDVRRGSDLAKNQGFWLSNLKLKIENACLTLGAFKLSHAMATQEVLVESLTSFYVKSVKSQALGLIDSIQVTSLVTSMVTGGVSSLMSTIMGKTDPSLQRNNATSTTFRYQFQTNTQIIQKHSKRFAQCRSSTQFLEQLKHLVFDWDSNHTGLEARGCVALGILNNSRHSLVVNTQLNDGAEIRVLPLGRRELASVVDDTDGSTQYGANEWRPDRAMVIFAWGYTPTLLTSGDVYFTVQSNACDVFVTRKTARLKANRGYTATFTHQETQSWWSTNVVIVGDEIQARTGGLFTSAPAAPVTRLLSMPMDSANSNASGSTRATRSSDAGLRADGEAYDLFGGGGNANTDAVMQDEYEVVFPSVSLGIIAKQSGRAVIVKELCTLPSGAPGPALATGRIAPGDSILTVSGMAVTNTTQFAQLVTKSPRPVVLRFRRTSEQPATAFNLFGEPRSSSVSQRTSTMTENDGEYDLFGAN